MEQLKSREQNTTVIYVYKRPTIDNLNPKIPKPINQLLLIYSLYFLVSVLR